MIRTFCDCCGNEITEKNSASCGTKDLGRLKAQVRPKISDGETMGVEVITAHEGTWNKGHFCRYCVIDAINTLDDRPRDDPTYPVRTELANLKLDLIRLSRGEPTLCNFEEVEELRKVIAGVTGGHGETFSRNTPMEGTGE